MTTTVVYTLSLHDALPIYAHIEVVARFPSNGIRQKVISTWLNWTRRRVECRQAQRQRIKTPSTGQDRKSTRLNSSHMSISYAVFCLKKKKHQHCRRVNHCL